MMTSQEMQEWADEAKAKANETWKELWAYECKIKEENPMYQRLNARWHTEEELTRSIIAHLTIQLAREDKLKLDKECEPGD